MTFKDRLQPSIALVSPTGGSFVAKWAGNDRSLEKRLAVFKTPEIPGVTVQDLDVEGVVYPLTIFFDGPDNDLNSDLFFKTCEEKGTWQVTHPVHGEKTLQLVSVSEAVQPVSSGNLTEFTTEWLEVTLPGGEISAPQLSQQILQIQQDLNASGADDFNETVLLDTADQATALEGSIDNTVSGFDQTLSAITSNVAAVQSTVDSIIRDIENTVFGPVTDLLSLAGQVQTLVSTPSLIITDLETMFDTFLAFADSILTGIDDPTPGEVNNAAAQDLTLTGATGAIGVSVTRAPLTSRKSVLDGIAGLTLIYNRINAGLTANQEVYAGQPLDLAYVAQVRSFSDALRMEALTLSFLLRSAFDLAVEKTITLNRAENPVMFAMDVYGGPGDNDSNIDLFFESNNLTGNETILMPAGKKVVVYV